MTFGSIADIQGRAAENTLRYFVTGTDTDVGKTRIAAGLAAALRPAGAPTIVKLVQTGATPDDEGDAARAGRLAGCEARELLRYERASDPWSASIAACTTPPAAEDLAMALAGISGPLVVEGSGGAAVPLRAGEDLSDVAAAARCDAVVVVALRLGCINHALLTFEHLCRRGVRVAAAVLVDRWAPTDAAYRDDVRRALCAHTLLVGPLAYEPDDARGVAAAQAAFAPLVHGRLQR